MTVTTRKGPRKKAPVASLPPSADIVTISGRDYIIAPYDEFREWEADRALAALMSERLAEGDSGISLEEFEKRIGQKRKGRKK